MDTADWDEAVIGLGQSASDVQLLGRLLDVDEHLAIWRERGAAFRAPMAADALDQALGLL